MKKSLGSLAGIALIVLSGQVFAAEDTEVGQKIYERVFGTGCGKCHDVASNPQLTSLIKAGKLDRTRFEKVIREGKGGMPKAMDAIMAVGPVKKAGYTETQALDALFAYLSSK